MELGKDFLDLLELMDQHRVEYLVVGGYATSVYAVPRYTKDLELWISTRPENTIRTMQALSDFGFGGIGLRTEDFQEADTSIQLGREPNRIDILTELKGLQFEPCFGRRRTIRLESGVRVFLIARDDLLANKKAVGRPQDHADIAAIEATPEPRFDD